MAETDFIVEGTKIPLRHTLTRGGSTFNASTYVDPPAIDMKDKNGATVSLVVSWNDPSVSSIQIDDVSSLTAALSPYTFRWKIEASAGESDFSPGAEESPNRIVVMPIHP